MPPIARPLARPLVRPLAMGLDVVSGPSYHPTTVGIIAAIVTAGATVSDLQKMAMDTFIRAEIAAGRWAKITWLSMPVWNVAAANGLDWTNTARGMTWVPTVTHASGHVVSDGTTGYGSTGLVFTSLFSRTAGTLGLIHKTTIGAVNKSGAGVGDAGNNVIGLGSQSSNSTPSLRWCGADVIWPSAAGTTGILIGGRSSGTTYLGRRVSGGWSSNTNSAALVGNVTNATTLLFLTRANFTLISSAQTSGMMAGALSLAEAEAFSANWSTLYTALTGNALPA